MNETATANKIHYNNCPVCGSASIMQVLEARDYTVSQERFVIWECAECKLRFTQDVPSINDIGAYYQSENYISHSNTSKGIVNALYHRVRKITLRSKQKLITKITGKPHGTLLDVGAGTGAFAAFMIQEGWQVTALEPDLNTIEKAKQLHNITLLPSSELFTLPPAQFDVITLWHVLEHVHDLHGYLRKFHELLKPDGMLVIAVPNYTSGDASNYKESWAAYDVPRHLYHFAPPSITRLLEKHGFIHQQSLPMWFDSFYVSLLSEKYKTGTQNLLSAFVKGIASNLSAVKDNSKASSLIYIAQKTDVTSSRN